MTKELSEWELAEVRRFGLDKPEVTALDPVLAEELARALCSIDQRQKGRTVDEVVAPGRELWMRYLSDAEELAPIVSRALAQAEQRGTEKGWGAAHASFCDSAEFPCTHPNPYLAEKEKSDG